MQYIALKCNPERRGDSELELAKSGIPQRAEEVWCHACPTPWDVSLTLPRRIWIVGCWGAGKTTLAKELGRQLGVEPLHLDNVKYQPGWKKAEPERVRERVVHEISKPAWVIDGNYIHVGLDLAQHADLVIWLDPSFLRAWSQVIRRSIRRIKHNETCCNGNREVWRHLFLPRHSAIWRFPRKYVLLRRELHASIHLLPFIKVGSISSALAHLQVLANRPSLPCAPPDRWNPQWHGTPLTTSHTP